MGSLATSLAFLLITACAGQSDTKGKSQDSLEKSPAHEAYGDIFIRSARLYGKPAGTTQKVMIGTAVLVDDTHALTAFHCVNEASGLSIERFWLSEKLRHADRQKVLRVAAVDIARDLALLELEEPPRDVPYPSPKLEPLRILDRPVTTDDDVYTYHFAGFPERHPPLDIWKGRPLTPSQFDIPTAPGASGGGVFVRTADGFALAGVISLGYPRPARVIDRATWTLADSPFELRISEPQRPSTLVSPAVGIRQFLANPEKGPALRNAPKATAWKEILTSPLNVRVSRNLQAALATLPGNALIGRKIEEDYGKDVGIDFLVQYAPGPGGWGPLANRFVRLDLHFTTGQVVPILLGQLRPGMGASNYVTKWNSQEHSKPALGKVVGYTAAGVPKTLYTKSD